MILIIGSLGLLLFGLAQVLLLIGLLVSSQSTLKARELPPGNSGLNFSVVDLRLHRRIVVDFSEQSQPALLFLTPRSASSRGLVKCLQTLEKHRSASVIALCSGLHSECQNMVSSLPSKWTRGYDEEGAIARAYGITCFPSAVSFSNCGRVSQYAHTFDTAALLKALTVDSSLSSMPPFDGGGRR